MTRAGRGTGKRRHGPCHRPQASPALPAASPPFCAAAGSRPLAGTRLQQPLWRNPPSPSAPHRVLQVSVSAQRTTPYCVSVCITSSGSLSPPHLPLPQQLGSFALKTRAGSRARCVGAHRPPISRFPRTTVRLNRKRTPEDRTGPGAPRNAPWRAELPSPRGSG